jgi:PEP-CTERM motif
MNSSAGVWSSVSPAANATGVGTNQIRWGDPAGGSGQSGYDYNGAAPPSQVLNTETQFLVGTFVHHNQPITGNTITGATLDITMNMTFGATNIVKTFTYDFEHTETPNSTPCQFPDAPNLVPCDDRVRILNNIPGTTFTVGGTEYTLSLLGFSLDGGTTVSDIFYTEELQDNTAQLFGKVTSDFVRSEVPEPSSIFLLATCAAGFCLRRFRRA